MKKQIKRKAYFLTTAFLIVILIFATLPICVSASEETGNSSFIGASSSLTDAELSAQTNTEKNADGSFTTPVSESQPQITVLVHGYASGAQVWSNNFKIIDKTTTRYLSLAYNGASIVEKLRRSADAKIYLAKSTAAYASDVENANGAIVSEGALIENAFELRELPDLCYCNSISTGQNCSCVVTYDQNQLSYITQITDTTSHIVLLFEATKDGATSSNTRVYNELNYIIDKVVYDLKQLNGGVLPRVNLIAHSRGSLTAIEYALEHPWLVDSLVTMGGVFQGSKLGAFEPLLNMLQMSNDPNNSLYTLGVADILNPDVYNSYAQRWNTDYEEKYSHIKFHAIGGYSTLNFLFDMLEQDDTYQNGGDYYDEYKNEIRLTNYLGELFKSVAENVVISEPFFNYMCMEYLNQQIPNEFISGILDYINDVLGYSVDSYPLNEYVIRDDLFIDLDSQLAGNYEGVIRYKRKFVTDDSRVDLEMVAQKNVAIVHNLEPGDAVIHNYILSVIDVNDPDDIYYFSYNDGECEVIGLRSPNLAQELIIPAEKNGFPVTSIGVGAFSGSAITTVTLPDSIKIIKANAFSDCHSLEHAWYAGSISTSQLEVIEAEAFRNCNLLKLFSFPNALKSIGSFAFSGCLLINVTLRENLQTIDDSAFCGARVQRFNADTAYFKDIDNVLYTQDESKLVTYPQRNRVESYTISPNTTEIGAYAFACSEMLDSLSLSNVTHIGDYAFLNSSVINFTGGENLEYVGNDVFLDSDILNNTDSFISIGDVLIKYNGTDENVFLSEYKVILKNAFYGNNFIKNVYLDGEIEFIRDNAFSSCRNLESIHLKSGADIYINDDSFIACDSLSEIYIPYVSRNFYYEYSNWQKYSDLLTFHTTTVNYDSMGGSSIPDGSFVYYKAIEELPTPTKLGYRFLGWKNSQNGAPFNEATVFLGYEDEITLIAEWEPEIYTVYLYTNVADLGVVLEYYTIEEELELNTTANLGYTFGGWYDNAALTGTPITKIPVGSVGNKYFYAKWTPNSYTVTLDYNYDGAPEPLYDTAVFGESFTFPVVEREGYYFDGWQYEATRYTNGNGESVMPWNIKSNVTLTARWSIERYYIKLDIEGNLFWATPQGVLSDIQIPIEFGTEFCSFQDLYNAFNESNISIREGHKFRYFTIDELAPSEYIFENNIVGDLGENETILVLYAHFDKEINFKIQPRNFFDQAFDVIEADYDEEIVLPELSKEGYTNFRWVVEVSDYNNNFNGTALAPGNSFSYSRMPDLSPGIEEDGSLIYITPAYKAETYTIKYVPNNDQTIADKLIKYASAAGTVTLAVPNQKRGYSFSGWFDGENGTGKRYTDASGVLIVDWDKIGTTTLYAKWIPINYNIIYHLNGGTNSGSNPATYTINSNIVLQNPNKAGFRFGGWYTDSTFDEASRITTIDKGSIGTKNLYAKWMQLYTVTFIQNNEPTPVPGIMGEEIPVPVMENNGYIFDCEGKRVLGGSNYTIVGNETFNSVEKTLLECYNSTNSCYEIYTYLQLYNIRTMSSDSNKIFVLMNDIDMSKYAWTPIPNFYGTINGNGKTIEHISFTVPENNTTNGRFGFIGNNYGTVRNLNIDGLSIDINGKSNTTWVFAGMLVGMNYGTISNVHIENCTLRADRSTTNIGGVAGKNHGGTISECTTYNLTFDGYGDMGAIVGVSQGGTISNCVSNQTYFTIKLNEENRSCGGIVAYVYEGGTLEYCVSKNAELTFSNYENMDDTEVEPYMGTVVGTLENSTMRNVGAQSCILNHGNLPERTGTIFNYHYPRQYIGAYGNGTCGNNINSTINNTSWSEN